MKLLIVGATGPLGLELLKRGVAAGHTVTALARRPQALANIAGVRAVAGDVLHPESLDAAVDGQDCVISALGSKLSLRRVTLLSDGTRNLVAAMQRHKVPRLLCVTGIGAGDSQGHGGWVYDHLIQPLLLWEVYRDKTRQEQVVRTSGLAWVIVRPAMLTDGPATGKYRAVTQMAGLTASKISRADVAAFLLRQVASDEFVGKAPVITD